MDSRERVLAALEHREPDRPPLDLGGSIVTGINAMAYAGLKRYLRARYLRGRGPLSGRQPHPEASGPQRGRPRPGDPGRYRRLADAPPRVTNIILLLAEVEPELVEAWEIDVLPVDRYFAAPGVPLSGRWKAHPLPDGAPALFPEGFAPLIDADGSWRLFRDGVQTDRLSPGSGSFVPTHFPLAEAGLEELEAFPFPRITDEELAYLAARARYLFENTHKALFGWFGGSINETAQFLSGFDTFFIRLLAEPEFTDRLLERLTEAAIADLKLYLQAVGPYVQVVGFGDDFGFQNGPQISPELFRSLFKPRLRRIYETAHALSSAKVFLHSCGSVRELIEDFIEIGVDILNPVQSSAAGMGVEELKRAYGGRIVFWGGGADVQGVLPLGSPEEVRADVRRRIEVMAPGGGFVFAPIHNLQADVPPANIAAMYEQALA